MTEESEHFQARSSRVGAEYEVRVGLWIEEQVFTK
jgi:hypothetical protein